MQGDPQLHCISPANRPYCTSHWRHSSAVDIAPTSSRNVLGNASARAMFFPPLMTKNMTSHFCLCLRCADYVFVFLHGLAQLLYLLLRLPCVGIPPSIVIGHKISWMNILFRIQKKIFSADSHNSADSAQCPCELLVTREKNVFWLCIVSELNVSLRNICTLYGRKTTHLHCLMYAVLGDYISGVRRRRNAETCKTKLAPKSRLASGKRWGNK